MSNTASRETLSSPTAIACVVLTMTAMFFAGCSRASSPVAPSDPTQTSASLVLTGAVTDNGASQPVASARVEIVDGVNQGISATADGQGRYDMSGLQPGTFSVRAQADGFEATSQSITLNDSRTVNFALRRKASGGQTAPATQFAVTGTVRDAASKAPIGNARVEIVDGANKGASTTADSNGRYAATSLSAGSFVIRSFADGYDYAQQNVTVGPDQTIDFSLSRKAGAPPAPSDPTPPSGPTATGKTIDALSARPLGGMTVRIDGLGEATTGSDGVFSIAGASQQQTRVVTVSSATTIERKTNIRVPGDAATLTLIPEDINLNAFDQMFRGDGALHRWVSAPRLLVQRRELTYAGSGDSTYVAGNPVMSDSDVQELVSDLTWALPQLTGGAFNAFADVVVETANQGDDVAVVRQDYIVVARFKGLTAATSYWGYTRWAWNGGGAVVAGVMMLDSDFEASGSPFHRSLRAHELGHALGYNHVSARDSVMNSAARTEPNGFDRDGSKIAFMRAPLNQSPDIDPDPLSVSRANLGQLRWNASH